MSLGMRKLAIMMTALSVGVPDALGDSIALNAWQKTSYRGHYPRLVGPAYSDKAPVLKRGKRRTRALQRAQIVDWHDPTANLYGCHPCPRCGEVRDRAAFKRPHGMIIECAACGDHRPVRANSPAEH